jgi:hypothetical protein
MELLTIHASKHGNWMESQDTSPALTVTNANSLHKAGWDVHVADSDGRRYGPMRFNEILAFARKPPIKFCFAAPRGETSRVTFGGTKRTCRLESRLRGVEFFLCVAAPATRPSRFCQQPECQNALA